MVHIEAGFDVKSISSMTSEDFLTFISTVVCKRCLSQSFRHQSTSCAEIHIKAVLCFDISIVSSPQCGMLQHKFSCLSQMRRGSKIALQAKSLCFCCSFLRDCSGSIATFGRLFTLRPPIFLFYPHSLYADSLLKTDFSDVSRVIFERGREKKKFSG